MKNVLIASGIVGLLTLTGCATNKAPEAPNGEHAPKHHHMMKKHKHHGEMTEKYTCEQDAVVNATYNPKKGTALLNITAPSLSLSGQDVTLNHDVSGSGMRFTNTTNPASTYEWHAKGPEAVLTVTAKGKAYDIKCQGEKPMHDHNHGDEPRPEPK